MELKIICLPNLACFEPPNAILVKSYYIEFSIISKCYLTLYKTLILELNCLMYGLCIVYSTDNFTEYIQNVYSKVSFYFQIIPRKVSIMFIFTQYNPIFFNSKLNQMGTQYNPIFVILN